MSKTGSVPTITPSQMEEICSASQQAVPVDLPFVVADYWEHNKGEMIARFQAVLRSAPVASVESPVLAKILADCQQAMRWMFGRRCPEVGPLPASVTEERVAHWALYNMRPVWIPEIDLTEDARLPKKWVRLGATFYELLRAGKIGEAIPGVPPTRLRAGWYLADMSVGVDYTDGTQVFPSDPWAVLFTHLRSEKLIGGYSETPPGSRFAITHDEWIQVVLSFMANWLGFPRANLRLKRASEFNAIGNIYDPNRGTHNMWVWLADPFEGSNRLIGGNRGGGGLAGVSYRWPDGRHGSVAAQPMAVLAVFL